MKTKRHQGSTTIVSNVLTVQVLPLIEKEPKKAKSEPRISLNDITEDNGFVEIEVVTPKLNDTGRREVNPEGNNSQINHITETHHETVKEGLFETAMGGVQENQ